ncbi:MAG: YdcF family protein [Flavobacteriales bacterium]|nr:YdcF family protein [Flavobacteriales bacterium]
MAKHAIKLSGLLALVFVVLAFTNIPYNAYHRLALTKLITNQQVDYIIIMGGDGMPSPSGLVRTYFGAEAGNKNPRAKIIIALPYNEYDSLYQLDLMAHELILKGIDTNRISYEPQGFNTYSQACNIAKMIRDKSKQILIVTAPEHMYRSVKCFEKQGFKKISSLPTFEIPSDAENLKDKTERKDTRIKNLSLRYNMWSYMVYEIKVLREYFAISYYKIKGWI